MNRLTENINATQSNSLIKEIKEESEPFFFKDKDIDLKTNNTDDLYALWYPYVSKRIVDKETILRTLKQMIKDIEKGGAFIVGEGLAFKCMQAIDNDEPLVPSHDKDDDTWFNRLRYDK